MIVKTSLPCANGYRNRKQSVIARRTRNCGRCETYLGAKASPSRSSPLVILGGSFRDLNQTYLCVFPYDCTRISTPGFAMFQRNMIWYAGNNYTERPVSVFPVVSGGWIILESHTDATQ